MPNSPATSVSPALAGDGAIDLRQLTKALLRRKFWILTPTLAALALSGAYVELATPRYTGVAKILLENQESYYTRPDKSVGDASPNLDTEGVQSAAEIALSPDLARRAVKALGLDASDEYARSSAGSLGLLGKLIGLGGGQGAANSEGEIVDNFLSHVMVFPIVRSRVLQVEFTSRTPATAADGANKVAQLILDEKENAKKQAAKSAGSWLAAKIDELRAKSADADQKVEAYRAHSGLLAGANNLTFSAQQLTDMNTQLAGARSAQSAALARAQMLRALLKAGRLDEIPDAAKDASLARFAEQRVTLKAQIASQARTLLPEHPHMKELAAQLAGLDEEMRLAAGKSVRGLENDARLAAAQVDGLNSALAKQSQTVAIGNSDEVQLHALELDATATHDQLTSYVQKYREAMARDADNAAPADARIVAAAAPPLAPTFPKKAPIVGLFSLAAFVVALVIAACHALLSEAAGVALPRKDASSSGQGAKKIEEVEDAHFAGLAEAAPANPAPRSAGASEYVETAQALATALIGFKHILIASDDLASSFATCLATARALSRQANCVLIDLSASMAASEAFDAPDAEDARSHPGLEELLSGAAGFADVLQRDPASLLDFIGAHAAMKDSHALEEAVQTLGQAYDHIVLHGADWRAHEALEALTLVDCVAIVGRRAGLDKIMPELRAVLHNGDIESFGVLERPPAAAERVA